MREALKKLEQLRLVAIRPGGGAQVAPVEGASIEILRHLLFAGGRLDPVVAGQLLDFRELLVVGSARLALERATEDDVREARALVARIGAPGATLEEHLAVTEQLFALTVRASGNLVLALVRNALLAHDDPALRATRLASRLEPGRLRPIREAVDAALAARDPEALERAVRRLLRTARPAVLSALAQAAPAFRPTPASGVARDVVADRDPDGPPSRT